MAKTASEVRIAGTGEVYVAPVNTAEPPDPTSALPSDWVGLGYTTDDGATIARSPNQENIEVWQSVTPVRIVATSLELTIQAQMVQSNADILSLYFGMPDGFEEPSAGIFRGEIPAVPEVTERALVMEWIDGELPGSPGTPLATRLWLPRSTLSDTGDTSLTRSDAVGWDMTWSALAPDSGPVGVILTNDPAFEPPTP